MRILRSPAHRSNPQSGDSRGRRSSRAPVALAFAAACVMAVAAMYQRRPAGSLSGMPLIVQPEETVVTGNGPQEIVVVLRNRTQSTLNITGLVAHCGCVVPNPPEAREVEPRGERMLRLRATPPHRGEKRTSVDIYYDDVAVPVVARLLLKGREVSVPAVVRQPTEVILRGRPGTEVHQDVELLADERRGAHPWVLGIDSDARSVMATALIVEDSNGPAPAVVRRVYRYRVSAKLDAPGRSRLASLEIRTGSPPDGPSLAPIAVMCDCKPSVVAIPDTVFAEVAASELPKEVVIRFRSESPSCALTVDRPKRGIDWLQVGDPVAAGTPAPYAATMHVRINGLPDENGRGSARAVIRLRTTASDCPALEIPVYVRRKREILRASAG